MQYTKHAMDFSWQLNILKQRGLTIENEEEALNFLHSVSYFRFANYLQPMELDVKSHQFAPNSSFSFATRLYIFDRELRSLVFTAIQDIEIAFRTRIIHYFSLEQSIAENGNFTHHLLTLVDNNNEISARSMGFPQEWKMEPLWLVSHTL